MPTFHIFSVLALLQSVAAISSISTLICFIFSSSWFESVCICSPNGFDSMGSRSFNLFLCFGPKRDCCKRRGKRRKASVCCCKYCSCVCSTSFILQMGREYKNSSLRILSVCMGTASPRISTEVSLLFPPFEEESIFISDIQTQPLGQIFYIEGELLVINEDQHFYTACSDCKMSFISSTSARPIYYIHCDRSTQLIPGRVQFEVTVVDHTGCAIAHTGCAIASISDQSEEKMLNLTVQNIYDICRTKAGVHKYMDF
ncbi:uncharacterized protein LOC132640807 isoform X2 [Lycium barbarum]|uniref:uncharacterized protein LOC132640807 isoform X2 n=1 Tax=Lycium barbarum TaxID=112863 RepID=UPI00293E663F|nr:uncharacterized protein LOC132640807 isoform X2 [Lycium barbarum]